MVGDIPPSFELGFDDTIPCNTTFTLNPLVTGGTGHYQYLWNIGSTDSSIIVSEGYYKLTIDDGTGCLSEDSIIVTPNYLLEMYCLFRVCRGTSLRQVPPCNRTQRMLWLVYKCDPRRPRQQKRR